MSVGTQILVSTRRYWGYQDPRYPLGTWQAVLEATGDASGGSIFIDHMFAVVTSSALGSVIWSVEQIALQSTDATPRNFQLHCINMGGPPGAGLDNQFALITAVDGTGGTSYDMTDNIPLPMFLGSQTQAGTTALFGIVGTNIDLQIVHFESQGYFWGARSVLVDGGPQRPPTGLYRA